MIEFIAKYWQWIIGVVLVPVVVAIIKVAFSKSGRKQTVGDIKGNGNQVINGDVHRTFTKKGNEYA